MDLNRLGFEELKRVRDDVLAMAPNTFRETEDGFENLQGDSVRIRFIDGLFRVRGDFSTHTPIQFFITTHSESVVLRGSTSREEMMTAIRAMLQEIGCWIIQ